VTEIDLTFRACTRLRAKYLPTIYYVLFAHPPAFKMVKFPEHCYCKYKKLLIFSTVVISSPISGSKSQATAPEIE